MPRNQKFKIPEDVLKGLEEKTTENIMIKIESIVAKKCKTLFGGSSDKVDDEAVVGFEIQTLKR